MDTEVQTLIDSIPNTHRYIVTNHLTLRYFAARYGLVVVGVVMPGGSTTSEPSVQAMLELIGSVEVYHVPAIFTETTVSEDLAQQIASESGVGLVRLYTDSLSQPDEGAGTYINFMLFNASAMADALQ
jgi:zinc/manganese transport system substrate-binding protein